MLLPSELPSSDELPFPHPLIPRATVRPAVMATVRCRFICPRLLRLTVLGAWVHPCRLWSIAPPTPRIGRGLPTHGRLARSSSLARLPDGLGFRPAFPSRA